jgi:glutaconate CoA-transferase subunit B
VDFITSPGHRSHGHTRAELGLPGAGPVRVVTDRAILDADPATGELVLGAVYPGVTAEQVRSEVGWDLRVRDRLEAVAAPSEHELTLLRDVLDPGGLYLKT